MDRVNGIYGSLPCKFVDLPNSMEVEIMDELQSLHEQWAGGIKLRPTSAYGVRLYQNGSSLMMHHDKVLCVVDLIRSTKLTNRPTLIIFL